MMLNDKKFCFIICTNSSLYYEECVRYIERLQIPEGYEVELLEIQQAKSLASAYNEAMLSTDAKYKIYLHQDVFILYPFFLQSVLDIFSVDDTIGMIGMVGNEKMSIDGVMWHEKGTGNLYGLEDGTKESTKSPYLTYRYSIADGLWNVEAIDGLLMITAVDITWREDLFDGWDFYDVSQSFEMRKRGYKIVVPVQKKPWVLHDDGILNLRNYDKYRQVFLKEYSGMMK